MAAPRFCRDCRHCLASKASPIYHRCGISLDLADPFYLTTGEAKYASVHCTSARSAQYTCGQDGTLWEPKLTDKELSDEMLTDNLLDADFRLGRVR